MRSTDCRDVYPVRRSPLDSAHLFESTLIPPARASKLTGWPALGARLRSHRGHVPLSIDALAQRACLSVARVIAIEFGRDQPPTNGELMSYARALEVDASAFCEQANEIRAQESPEIHVEVA